VSVFFIEAEEHSSLFDGMEKHDKLPDEALLICISRGVYQEIKGKEGKCVSGQTFGGRVDKNEVMAMNEMHIILVCTFDHRWS